MRLFAYNRFGLFSFFDSDHGAGDDGLRAWTERLMAKAGVEPDGGPIRLLCYPRILGYVFNPLTVYFCHARSGALAALFYEVSNTHGERHTYVIPVDSPAADVVRQTCRKEFYVSPFIPMNGAYRFAVRPPGESVSISIENVDDNGVLLAAVFSGRRRPLTDATLLRAFFAYPLMTLKVTAGIHWEALRLILKGTKVFDHTAARQRFAVSIVRPSEYKKAPPGP
jgi:DUF1365 family protein